jgi:hypothetical protein
MIAKVSQPLSVQRFQKRADSNTLGSGPINLMEMAPEMTRAARRDARNGVVSPVKRFDAADRQSQPWHFGVQRMWSIHPATLSKNSKMDHISFAFSPRIRMDGLTPFSPN